jgi:SAM-dependent methyltransferase
MTSTAPPANDVVSAGSPDRFGFSWDTYSELLPEHEEQFRLWTTPLQRKDWLGKTFLDAGCGMGRNSYWPLRDGAARCVAIDMDERTLGRARHTLAPFANAEVRRQSIYEVEEENVFDIAFSIGVIHHLADPPAAVARLARAVRPGGEVLVWLYGREGNGWIVWLFNPVRKFVFSRMPLSMAHACSLGLTSILWLVLRPNIGLSPYLRQIRGFRFRHLRAIVFDHMLPHIALYYRRAEAIALLEAAGLTDVRASWTNRMSWTVSGKKPL